MTELDVMLQKLSSESFRNFPRGTLRCTSSRKFSRTVACSVVESAAASKPGNITTHFPSADTSKLCWTPILRILTDDHDKLGPGELHGQCRRPA